MILILTFKEYEQSTDPVVDWLLFYKVPFLKIFIEDLLSQSTRYRIDITNKKIYIEDIEITHKINVVFYRRFEKKINFKSDIDLGHINSKINREVNGELKDLFNYLFYILDDKIWFPHYSKLSVNKLEVLDYAKESGLKIPESIVTNSKRELIRFKDEMGGIVNKPIRQVSYYTFGKYTYSPYTTEINDETIEELEEYFFPSLFQTKIKGDYEVRCFYLDGDFYASAILTSIENADIKLSIDSELTKWQNYNLPEDLKSKLNNFMISLNLNTGSIDLIKTLDDEYYFIEVNPVGQFLYPSVQCNYYVEKEIAKWLIKKNYL